ncbi:MAG: Crp/Fnr family transcriptional regulator [Bacillaceae bacterium]
MTLKGIFENCPSYIKEKFIYEEYVPGDIVMEQDVYMSAGDIYILLQGNMKVTQLSKKGTTLLLCIIKEWELFGDLEVFSQRRTACSVEALSPCKVVKISKSDFLLWLKEDFELVTYLLENYTERLLGLAYLTTTNTVFSLEYRFLILLDSFRTELQMVVPYSKDIIAEMLGTSVRSVNRIIQKLVKKEIISYEKGIIKIQSYDKIQTELNKQI